MSEIRFISASRSGALYAAYEQNAFMAASLQFTVCAELPRLSARYSRNSSTFSAVRSSMPTSDASVPLSSRNHLSMSENASR
jgi:hypothetical protein